MPTSERKRLRARFYESDSGRAPVEDWLDNLPEVDRRTVELDIRKVEFGWPIGMPICRPIKGRNGLWEIRSRLGDGRAGRLIFYIEDGEAILLHGFVKKSSRTPERELRVAEARMRNSR